jgi:hypothetical protein
MTFGFLHGDHDELRGRLERDAAHRSRGEQAEVNKAQEALVASIPPGPAQDAAMYWMMWADILAQRLMLSQSHLAHVNAWHALARVPPAGTA